MKQCSQKEALTSPYILTIVNVNLITLKFTNMKNLIEIQSIIDEIWVHLGRVHDIDDPQEGFEQQRVEIACDKAQKYFPYLKGKGSEEIISFLREVRVERELKYDSTHMEGIFCDMRALVQDDTINKKIFDFLNKGDLEEKEVYICTDEPLSQSSEILKKNNITWQLVRKQDYTGAIVDYAIDVVDQMTFIALYKIKPKNFIQV